MDENKKEVIEIRPEDKDFSQNLLIVKVQLSRFN
jgi:hypothetical protein